MNTIKKITLIGSGNVASHLGKAFFDTGFIINEVYSKSIDNAKFLSKKLHSSATDSIRNLKSDSDVYIICIKDDSINYVVKEFLFFDKLIVHTSGSVAMEVLTQFQNYGIFYPLQTFSKEKNVMIAEVPLCIEASDKKSEQMLINLGKSLSKNVHLINSQQREKIHLAAVFACNFTNYMYTISEDILTQNNIDFDILKPLILETAKKINDNSPKAMQTGPAKRNDEVVMQHHINLLANNKDYQEIYQLITSNILGNSK